jgi:putative ABC transport system ATP-binding protein
MIRTQGLTKEYVLGEQVVRALDGVDLHIGENDLVAIQGPSGSGKSTLMNLLGFLDTPTRGDYWLYGRSVGELSDDEATHIRNTQVGFVFQTFHLLPRLSARKNVELPLVYAGFDAGERRARATETLEQLGLADRMEHRPNQLSGGQRQRVAIARALVNRPSIILADEPTGNLDSHTSAEIMDVFRDLHRAGQTIIIVTHESEVARHTHRQIHLRDGRIERDSAANGLR